MCEKKLLVPNKVLMSRPMQNILKHVQILILF